jgi:hypothetical protein
MAETRVGYWYTTGPADKEWHAGEPAFSLHTVISDESTFAEHVASPKGHTYSHSGQKFVEMPKTAAV